jgi:hypothetical protein
VKEGKGRGRKGEEESYEGRIICRKEGLIV